MPSGTGLHPAVQAVIEQFQVFALHAARSGREVMDALSQLALDSSAQDSATLAAEIDGAVNAILAVMPPYAPPLNVMHRLMARLEGALRDNLTLAALKAMIAQERNAFHDWSASTRDRIADFGAALVPDGATVFTYTLSETTLRTLRHAANLGRHFKVIVTESRPNNDGLVTARELSQVGVEIEVSIDACLGKCLRRSDVMMIGAEAINPDGSAVCKVGTYPSALVARAYGVPVYLTVDTLKFNVTGMTGLALAIDNLKSTDILLDGSSFPVAGHWFDTTPPELLRAIVTERGLLSPGACATIMLDMPISTGLTKKLRSRY